MGDFNIFKFFAGKKKTLYRGLTVDLDHPELADANSLVQQGQYGHPDLGRMILDHVSRDGMGKWWTPSLSQSHQYSEPRSRYPMTNPLQVHLTSQWQEGEGLDPDEYEWDDYTSQDPQVVLAPGTPLHVYNLKVRHPQSKGWQNISVEPSMRTT